MIVPFLAAGAVAIGSAASMLIMEQWWRPYRKITAAIQHTQWYATRQAEKDEAARREKEWEERMKLVGRASKSIEQTLIETSTDLGIYHLYKNYEKRETPQARVQRVEFSWVLLGWDFVIFRMKLPYDVRPHEVLNNVFIDDWRVVSGRPDLQIIRTDRHGLFVMVPLHGATDGIPDLYRWRAALKTLNEELPERPLAIPIGLAVNRRFTYIDPTAGDSPHILVAGATKSGKSVCVNSIMCSLLDRNPPDRIQLVLVDMKRVEMYPYRRLAHYLWRPIAIYPQQVLETLDALMEEMMRRLGLMASADSRDLSEYNRKAERPEPFLFCIIDELALVIQMVPGAEIKIGQLAAVGRAAGIHLILATQRPSADVVTGIIKSNMDTRLAFNCADRAHSETILNNSMAVGLSPKGRAIFWADGEYVSLQSPLITTEEVLATIGRAAARAPKAKALIADDVINTAIEKRTNSMPELFTACRKIQEDLTAALFLSICSQLRYIPPLAGPVIEAQGGRWVFVDGRAIPAAETLEAIIQ